MELLSKIVSSLTALVLALQASVAVLPVDISRAGGGVPAPVAKASGAGQGGSVLGATTQGLVGYWNFDEGSGTTAADTSGSGNTGTLVNGPTWTTGKVGGALSFDGVDDVVSLPDPSVLDFSGTNAFTISVWAYPQSGNAGGVILARGGVNNGASNDVYNLSKYAFDETRWRVEISDGITSVLLITNANSVVNNAWQYITFVWNGLSDTLSIYKNGISIGNTTSIINLWDGGANANNRKTGIGYNKRSNNSFFKGSLDDVRIYNRALAPGEITSLYDLGSTDTPASVNGTCGPASKTYTPTESFPQGVYCSTGTPSPSSPADPAQGSISTWSCTGSTNGGTTASCSATRQTQQTDTISPVISSIQSSNITSNSATIQWTTNESSDTQIEYGLTTSYGSQTTRDITLITTHQKQITNLQPNTMYHYRVISMDQAGNLGQGQDQVLTTLATTPSPAGNTFYIRDGGTSTICTDWANACDSLPAALVRGATYYIADGNYGAYTFDDPVSGSQYITIKKATVSDHATNTGWIDSYGDGTAQWAPTIMFKSDYYNFDGVTGGGSNNWDGGFGFRMASQDNVSFILFSDKYGALSDRVNVSNINISHIELAGRSPVSPGWGTGFNATTYQAITSNIRISNCYVHDIGGAGFYWYHANNILVENCYVARNASSATAHGTAFRMDDVHGMVLRNSLFEDIVGTGFVGGYDIGIDDVKIYGNVFRWTPNFNGETNIVADGGYGNGVIYSVGASGPITNWKIYNNTFFHLPDASPIINLNNAGIGNEAYNNLFSDFAGPPFYNGVTLHDYNYFSIPGGTYSEIHSQNAGNTNPFANWQNKDFRLLNGTSPGMNLGTQYGTDAYSSTRGADGIWDIGAYEFVSGGAPLPPPPPGPPSPTPPPPSPSPLSADFNQDGIVNSLDFSLLSRKWLQSHAAYDLNSDGTINSLDFSIMLANWLK